jgi:hypothetical protein
VADLLDDQDLSELFGLAGRLRRARVVQLADCKGFGKVEIPYQRFLENRGDQAGSSIRNGLGSMSGRTPSSILPLGAHDLPKIYEEKVANEMNPVSTMVPNGRLKTGSLGRGLSISARRSDSLDSTIVLLQDHKLLCRLRTVSREGVQSALQQPSRRKGHGANLRKRGYGL